jgi:hypothetical protein
VIREAPTAPRSLVATEGNLTPRTASDLLFPSGRHPTPQRVAGRFRFAASAEAGREFDKLATDLTTPRDSLTRELNLVVSLSRRPR